MVFDHTPLTPSPSNLNYGIFSQNFRFLLKMAKLTL